jgi:glycerate kinase
MPLKVLIIPDKFKGTLTAKTAAETIARGWSQSRPQDKLELLPMSDGGDGFGEVMSDLFGGAGKVTRTVNAAHQPRPVQWWWVTQTRTAIIESAQIIGLALLPPGKYHPFDLDTYGLGPVFQAAARLGADNYLVGIGGSATNDGGFGLACALGWRFLDHDDQAIQSWVDLINLKQIRPPPAPRSFKNLTVAVDVQNPLLGRRGATKVYGPQKGIGPRDFARAEKALHQLAQTSKTFFRRDFSREPGTGAAGGLGFGLRSFLRAKMRPGFELFARHANLADRLADVSLVITGEGKIDRSTLMGKGVGQLAQLCRAQNVPCIGLCGILEHPRLAQRRFAQVRPIVPDLASQEQAQKDSVYWLRALAAEVAGHIGNQALEERQVRSRA